MATADIIPFLPSGSDKVGDVTIPGFYDVKPRDSGFHLVFLGNIFAKDMERLEKSVLEIAQNQSMADPERTAGLTMATHAWVLTAQTMKEVREATYGVLQEMTRSIAS